MFKVIAVHCFRMFVFVLENVPTVWMLVFSEVYDQQFYDNIEENEEQFLGHAFVRDDDRDSEFVQSSDSEVQADDNNEERSDTVDDTENIDDDNIVIGEQEELPRK